MKALLACVSTLGFLGIISIGNIFTYDSVIAVTANSAECNQAIAQTKSQLSKIKKLNLISSQSKDISNLYKDFPAGKNIEQRFVFTGKAAANVLNSPKMLGSMSNNIIKKCNSTGAVFFGIDRSDNSLIYGLVNNQITQFECLSAGIGAKPKWGQLVCS
jgi:hypothetical protein